jgi:hypothetical protein
VHYIEHGQKELRNPNKYFDAAFYIKQTLHGSKLNEVPELKAKPLEHYLKTPIYKRQATHPRFDTQHYLTSYPELLISQQDPLLHYLTIGRREEREAYIEFDAEFYLRQYPDVAQAKLDPKEHYLNYGKNEGRLPKKTAATGTISVSKLLIERALKNLSEGTPMAVPIDLVAAEDQSTISESMPSVYWGTALSNEIDRRLIETTARALPSLTFLINEQLLYDYTPKAGNIKILHEKMSMKGLERGQTLFIQTKPGSALSELTILAIAMKSLLICSDDCAVSSLLPASAASYIPTFISVEALVHALTYSIANPAFTQKKVRLARELLARYHCQ